MIFVLFSLFPVWIYHPRINKSYITHFSFIQQKVDKKCPSPFVPHFSFIQQKVDKKCTSPFVRPLLSLPFCPLTFPLQYPIHHLLKRIINLFVIIQSLNISMHGFCHNFAMGNRLNNCSGAVYYIAGRKYTGSACITIFICHQKS